jgi:hypothetical protein
VNGEALSRPGGSAWSLGAAVRARLPAALRSAGAVASGRRPSSRARAAQVNIEARAVAPARPVIHLAVALVDAWQAMQREAASGPRDASLEHFDWWQLVGDQSRFALVALDLAERLEESVTRLPAGGPRAGELVRIRHVAP